MKGKWLKIFGVSIVVLTISLIVKVKLDLQDLEDLGEIHSEVLYQDDMIKVSRESWGISGGNSKLIVNGLDEGTLFEYTSPIFLEKGDGYIRIKSVQKPRNNSVKGFISSVFVEQISLNEFTRLLKHTKQDSLIKIMN